MRLPKWLPFVSVALGSFVFILLEFGTEVLSPNGFLLNDSGDGIKNYFTFAWHVTHDPDTWNFEGFHYPFGEHIFYTDGHPLVAGLLQPFGGKDSWVSAHVIGILNALLFLGVWLTFLVAFQLFRAYGVRPWLAALFAVGAGALQPQLFRLEGHYALSYGLALPLSWLLWKRSLAGGRRDLILLAGNHVLWMGMHAYLGVMAAFFVAGMALLAGNVGYRRKVVTCVAALSPVLVYLFIGWLTDIHLGRTTNPSGLFLYNAEPDDLLVPHHGPIRNQLNGIVPGIKLKWEAWAYVGLSGVACVLSGLVGWVIGRFSAGFKLAYMQWLRPLVPALGAAAVLYLFALGIPFKQWPELADWFPVFKQFRATGRFSWPLWWVVTAMAARGAELLWKNSTPISIKRWAVVSAGLLGVVEGHWHMSAVGESTMNAPNAFAELPEAMRDVYSAMDSETTQAILPLPFYHLGSEQFTRPRQPEVERAVTLMAYHTGVPLMSAALTRVSIPETLQLFEALSPCDCSGVPLPLNAAPIAVLRSGEALFAAGTHLWSKAEATQEGLTDSEDGQLRLAWLNPDELAVNVNPTEWDLMRAAACTEAVQESSELARPSRLEWAPERTLAFQKAGDTLIESWECSDCVPGDSLHVSLWLSHEEPDALNLWFRLRVQEVHGEATTEQWILPEQSSVILDGWTWVELTVPVQEKGSEFKLLATGKPRSKATVVARGVHIK